MPIERLREIADRADMIVRRYAFTWAGANVSVINLNHPDSAMLMTTGGEMLESSMEDIEQVIVQKIWERDAEFMETSHA